MSNRDPRTAARDSDPPGNLTRWEWSGLQNTFNLADGHAHQALTPLQQAHVERLSDVFHEASSRRQAEVQDNFVAAFFRAAGQHEAVSLAHTPLFHYSSSISIEAVANLLRERNAPVALVTPTFDNIPAIMRRHGISLRPLEEKTLLDPAAWSSSEPLQVGQALFLVLPNNPTGAYLGERDFADLCTYCKLNGKLLVLDLSFRFFSKELSAFDQYSVLQESGVEFITIEDTGKTWPTLDMKVGFVLSSPGVAERLRQITDDFLLNVSPFVLVLLTQFACDEPGPGQLSEAAQVARKNRLALKRTLEGLPVQIVEPACDISVAWLRLPAGWSGNKLVEQVEKTGVSILPGEPFYWHAPVRGREFVRVALLRPADYFNRGSERLRQILVAYRPNPNLVGDSSYAN